MSKLNILGTYLTSSFTSSPTDLNLKENAFGSDKNDSLLHIYAGNRHTLLHQNTVAVDK